MHKLVIHCQIPKIPDASKPFDIKSELFESYICDYIIFRDLITIPDYNGKFSLNNYLIIQLKI